jgi:hypothetical protein
MDPRAGLYVAEKRKFPTPVRDRTQAFYDELIFER